MWSDQWRCAWRVPESGPRLESGLRWESASSKRMFMNLKLGVAVNTRLNPVSKVYWYPMIKWRITADKTGFLSINQSSLSHYLAVLWILGNKSSRLPQKGTTTIYFCEAVTVLGMSPITNLREKICPAWAWVGLSQTCTNTKSCYRMCGEDGDDFTGRRSDF